MANRYSTTKMLGVHQEDGFTFIEVIIALALLSVTIVGATATFLSLSRLHRSSLTVQAIQQESRAIVEAITRDVRTGSTVDMSPTGQLLITSSVTLDRIEYYRSADNTKIIRRFCEKISTSYSCSPEAEMNQAELVVEDFQFEINRNGPTGAFYVAFHFAFEYNGTLSAIDPLFQRYELNPVVTVRSI